jgi:chorismate mutase/prephenate dehydrogenase
MSLEDLRQALTSIDRQIVELIADRQKVVDDIGKSKQSTGRATRDYEREKDVLDSAREHAGSLGVDPNLAEEILTSLIRASLTHQERSRVEAQAAGDGRRALIIGGAGKMGGWFVDYFSSQGFLTVIADTSVKPGPGKCRDWRQAGTDYDVIVVATPMAVSGQVLADLAELKPEGLIGCKVASLHPMYGPDTELLSGRHLIFVDAGCPEATIEAKALFSATMVEELDMSLDDHDRLIAYVLGLSHALNIAFFTALAESGEAAPKLAKLSSTTFDAQLLVSGAVAHDNPRMYFEIQNLNDFGMDPLDALCESAARIREVVADGDEEGFVELMHKGREYLATRK